MDKQDREPDEVDDRPDMAWIAEGILLSQRVLVVALAMSLPILIGYLIDQWIRTKLPWGLLAGSAFGMLSGGWELRRLLRWLEERDANRMKD